MGKLILLLGGARSGKSTYAEQWAQTNGQEVLFVATAQAFDEEMTARIRAHRASRPAHWHTLETPQHLVRAMSTDAHDVDTVIVDCVTLWMTNLLLSFDDNATEASIHAEAELQVMALLQYIAHHPATWLLVTNEVGMGVVPPTRLGRFFRDVLGFANQRLASHADEVILLVAGLPWRLK